MFTEAFIVDLFWRVDGVLGGAPEHPQAKLYPSKAATLALLAIATTRRQPGRG